MGLGGEIVFASGKAGDYDIFWLSLNTWEVKQLTTGDHWNDHPRWSPDGSKILYVSNRSGVPQLWLMDPDGANQTLLTQEAKYHSCPNWSPDGKKLVFCGNYDDPDNIDVYTMDLAGGTPERVVNTPGVELDASWSPDGRSLLYTSETEGNYDVWRYDFDSGESARLTTQAGRDFAAVYSPDGLQIAFISETADEKGKASDSNVWIMNADGGGERKLTNNRRADRYVSWSPDGKYVLYCASSSGLDWWSNVVSDRFVPTPSIASPETGRLTIAEAATGQTAKVEYDRELLEKEIGVQFRTAEDIKETGIGPNILITLLSKFGLLHRPLNAVMRESYSEHYFGTERYPHWKA